MSGISARCVFCDRVAERDGRRDLAPVELPRSRLWLGGVGEGDQIAAFEQLVEDIFESRGVGITALVGEGVVISL